MAPHNKFFTLAVLIAALLTGGCVSSAKTPTSAGGSEPAAQARIDDEGDPWEGFNRAVFKFNTGFDRNILRPVARGYKKLPAGLRRSVGNFFRNLLEPTTFINDLLQGKFDQAPNDFGRFVVNSTIGILGLFDVATPMGMPRHEEDFGQTLAVWGVKPGPYLMLPFIGPSNVRDGFGLLPYYFYTDPRLAVDDFGTAFVLVSIDVVDRRSRLLAASRVLQMQLDPYIFTRESYRQKRLDLIHNGNVPLEIETGDAPAR